MQATGLQAQGMAKATCISVNEGTRVAHQNECREGGALYTQLHPRFNAPLLWVSAAPLLDACISCCCCCLRCTLLQC
eukprot:1143983-Pelagomonas_calceolata.AAC.2